MKQISLLVSLLAGPICFLVLLFANLELNARQDQDLSELKSTALIYPSLKPIQGRVVNESGWPIPGAVVLQHGKSRGNGRLRYAALAPYAVSHREVTDFRGNFKIQDPEIEYPTEFIVVHPDYALQRIPALSLYHDIVLSKQEDLVGRVLHHDGSPAENVRLERRNVPDEEALGFKYGQTTTDRNGNFVLPQAFGQNRETIYVTIPGELQWTMNWYPEVESMFDGDPIALEARGNDFEMRLLPTCAGEISAVSSATEQPVEIASAQIAHSRNPELGSRFRGVHSQLKIEGNKISTPYLRKGVNRIWIHPIPSSKLAAGFFDLTIDQSDLDQATPKQIVARLTEGAQVSGSVVDATTGVPIENAAIAFLPLQPGRLTQENLVYPEFVRTDQDGRYSTVVPAGPVVLRVVGECRNYKTLPARNFKLDKFSPEVVSRLIRSIDVQAGSELVVPTFKLQKSPTLSGVVVGLDHQPLADVCYIVHRQDHEQRPTIFGKTDQNGRFEIDSIFTNAMGFPERKPNVRYSSPPEDNFRILFWHADRVLSKQVLYNESQLEPMTVQLEESLAAWGRVVDADSGEPVEGAQISVGLNWYTFSIGAKSRADGTFLVEHVPREGATATAIKAEYAAGGTTIDFAPDAPELLVVELPDTKIRKRFPYGKPAKTPDISELPPAEALAATMLSLETELDKLPLKEIPAGGMLWLPSPVSDAEYYFINSMANQLTEQGKILFADNQSEEFKTQAALAILNKFSDGHGGHKIPFSPITIQAQAALIDNIDREGVFEAYKNYHLNWVAPAVNRKLFHTAQSPEARKWILRTVLQDLNMEIQRGMDAQHSPGQAYFDKTLQEAVKTWKIALADFPDERIVPRTIQGSIDKLNRQPKGSFDEQRADQLRETINELLNKK